VDRRPQAKGFETDGPCPAIATRRHWNDGSCNAGHEMSTRRHEGEQFGTRIKLNGIDKWTADLPTSVSEPPKWDPRQASVRNAQRGLMR